MKTTEGKIEIDKARSMRVTKTNALVQKTRYSLTIAEQKALCYVISLLKKKESEPPQLIYKFDIVDYCRIVGIQVNGKNYSDVKKNLKGLSDKSFWITEWDEKGKPAEKLLRWINEVTIKPNSGNVTIEISKNMIPYLFNLYNNFVSYQLYWILALSSTYSIQFYELLSSYLFVGKKEFEIGEIRKMINCENKYKGYKDLKKWVFEPSVTQINEYTNLTVEYFPIKRGRTITSIVFKVKKKKNIDSLISYRKTIAKVNGMEFNEDQHNIFEYLMSQTPHADLCAEP